MQQLTQKLKNGEMQVLDVPVPQVAPGMILVRNHYSLISAGTEGSTVKSARSGFIAKAKERPQQVRQVLDTLRSQGITQTYRAVMKKLDAYSPLGYSSAGEVIGVAADVQEFRVGDLVGCAGLTASHAEVVSVPKNLCVKLSPKADLCQSAYNTLGAIAMQGVRQADLRLGETCAVIGLGLLGQLTALILRASGVRVVGIDIDSAMVETASKHCADLALHRNQSGIENRIQQFTDGLGCDAVIIAAATSSLDPINFAGTICRKRGTVVVVGAVPTGFDRDPHYYRKELQLKMSCSYGPGRYESGYEEKGLDYPAAYVRWTENRNMLAFQQLLESKRIDVSYLTTHTFKLIDAIKAYDLLMNKSAPFVGILIEYDQTRDISKDATFKYTDPARIGSASVKAGIGFIGAGSYAQSHLLPNIQTGDGVVLRGVMTTTPTSAKSVADRYGFRFCTCRSEDIFSDAAINTVFIASRHDTHAAYVKGALLAGRNVFVEKPLCLTIEELREIFEIRQSMVESRHLLIGFNRRFAPLSMELKKNFSNGPLAMTYRVNAGAVPKDSWIQDPQVGGGRIIGEVCHFIDFMTWLNGSLPLYINCVAMDDPNHLLDTVIMTLTYGNGSIGTVSYFANGDKSFPKERIEVFGNNCSAVLDDFRSLTIHSRGKKSESRSSTQDKGQKNMVSSFISTIKKGGPELIGFNEIISTTIATFGALESIRSGQSVSVDLSRIIH